MSVRVALLHNEPGPEAGPDEADVLVQVRSVGEALAADGHEVRALPCGLDLDRLSSGLREVAPDVVFNLVEDLGGHGRLIATVPYLLEALGVPHTGCPADAVHLTSHKTLAKQVLRRAGVPTPAWVPDGDGGEDAAGRWIVKPVWEDASVGIDDGAVVGPGRAAALERIGVHDEARGGPWFGEVFVEGREFNLSLLETADGPTVLPAAEMLFAGFPPGKPRIVGYAAKWEPDSFEYRHTIRHFPRDLSEAPLLDELRRLSLLCWEALGLGGYARVDFRVDERGRPFVLEVNANPCLSPDAGFAAALAEAGTTYTDAVGRILAAAR